MEKHPCLGKSIGILILTNGVFMIWGVTFLLSALKLIGLITAPWVLIFLPMILTSSFIIFGLAYIGFNKLEEEEEWKNLMLLWQLLDLFYSTLFLQLVSQVWFDMKDGKNLVLWLFFMIVTFTVLAILETVLEVPDIWMRKWFWEMN